MKEKRTLILLGILVALVIAGGAWFFLGGSNETTTTKIPVAKIRKKATKVVKKVPPTKATHRATIPKTTKAIPQKDIATIFGMFPIDPGDNFAAGSVDVVSFEKTMGPRLSEKERATLERMSLKSCGYVLWPKGMQDQFHYAVICSTNGSLEVVKRELTKKKTVVEGTCGKTTKCLQISGDKGKSSYLAFKGKEFMVLSDVASLVASMVTTAPNPQRAERWAKLLPMKKNGFGVVLVSLTPTESTGGVSDFTPSNLGKRSNVNISKVLVRGDFGFIPKGILLRFKVDVKDKENKSVNLASVPGKVTLFDPSLPSDAFIAGIDLNAFRKSIEVTTAKYKGRPDPELQKIEGRIFFELSFNNGRPLVYLKMVDLKEHGPILKKLGKPGDEVDITTMINPFLAMFLGKTSFKRIKGGFIATNLVGTNLTPSKAGLKKSKALLEKLQIKSPLGLIAVSPPRLTEGVMGLIQPFVAKNPQLQQQLKEMQQKMRDKKKPKPERAVFISKSLTEYELRVEYSK